MENIFFVTPTSCCKLHRHPLSSFKSRLFGSLHLRLGVLNYMTVQCTCRVTRHLGKPWILPFATPKSLGLAETFTLVSPSRKVVHLHFVPFATLDESSTWCTFICSSCVFILITNKYFISQTLHAHWFTARSSDLSSYL